MAKTPNRFPGVREDEGLILDVDVTQPAVNGEIRYVNGVGFRFWQEGVAKQLGVSELDFLLADDPVAEGITYSVTYGSGGKVTNETWVRTSGGFAIKTCSYTYTGSRVNAAVTKVYAADGITVLAQTTETYSYSEGKVLGSTLTRDI